jgi:hypothetical protein
MHAVYKSPRASGLFGIALLALILSGCGRANAPAAPTIDAREGQLVARPPLDETAGPNANPFYPLEVGNHWGYEHTLALYVVPAGGPPGPVFGSSDRRDRELVCIEQRAGRSYVVERELFGGSPPWWLLYRQDEAGLYELDGPTVSPPCGDPVGRRAFDVGEESASRGEKAWLGVAAQIADPALQVAYRAAWDRVRDRSAAVARAVGAGLGMTPGGGVEAGEITRLQYPLHPRARWLIRADPRFESVVEGAEALDLAVGRVPGWRIRIESEFLGPEDRVHVWYGRTGFLMLAAHIEEVATDERGNPIGTVVGEETEELIALSLNRGRFATP